MSGWGGSRGGWGGEACNRDDDSDDDSDLQVVRRCRPWCFCCSLNCSLPLSGRAQALRQSLAESQSQHSKGRGVQRRRAGGGRDCQSVDSDEDSVICVGEDEQRKSATEAHRRGGERHKPAGRNRTILKRSSAGDDAVLVDSASEGESSPGRERGCQAKAQGRKTGGSACAGPQRSPTVPATR